MIITSPIVDLRKNPTHLHPHDYSHNDERETQLLFNERVEVLSEQEEWLCVQTMEQSVFSEEEGWHHYPGWIHRTEVRNAQNKIKHSFVVASPFTKLKSKNIIVGYGTLLSGSDDVCDPKDLRLLGNLFSREQLVNDAYQFLGTPYLWGGRAMYNGQQIGSVDCSGLINLLYRAQGISIPRNAHDQFLLGEKIEKPLPGDPVYLSKDSKRVNHVILKIDETHFIEAPETGKNVRLLEWGKDLWEENGMWHFFDRPNPYFFSFRSLIKSTIT